ncbi:MAG TPA: rhamnogalacturonan acetylesterase, partial [Terriglobales bacterium]|nr:rhamnogalacturonan acetylesterase [Terriglobales bacterium]
NGQESGRNISQKSSLKFSFGEQSRPGYISITANTAYNPDRGYGLMLAANLEASARSLCSKGASFLFAVDLAEGNYDVKLTLGGADTESVTTVKAEARRLFLKRVIVPPRKLLATRFTLNLRSKELTNGEVVRIKKDEENDFDWDHRLTLEFNNTHPCASLLELTRNNRAITVFIAGDSTVTDQRREPWAAWGQMLPQFFNPGVAIANHAESGESLKSFIGENRLAKLLEDMKPGDYLFIQFAHNDQKPGASHVDPFTTYKEYLTRYIDEARKRKAIPVLVTSMHRRRFDANGKIINTLEHYPEAMRQHAQEQKVALIDLNAMSKILFETLGPEGTLKVFVHYPAHTFPGQEEELKDDTHFNAYGAYELARCVVEGIRRSHLGLRRYLRTDMPRFDPAHPDLPEGWMLLQSP